MQPPGRALVPAPAPAPPLPPAVAAELEQLEWRLGQVTEEPARRELAELPEAAAVRVLRKVARSLSQAEDRGSLTGRIVSVAVEEMFARNARDVLTAESLLACNSAPSLSGEARLDPTPPWPHSSSSLEPTLPFFVCVWGLGRKAVFFFCSLI